MARKKKKPPPPPNSWEGLFAVTRRDIIPDIKWLLPFKPNGYWIEQMETDVPMRLVGAVAVAAEIVFGIGLVVFMLNLLIFKPTRATMLLYSSRLESLAAT
jgi:hypothetical protein